MTNPNNSVKEISIYEGQGTIAIVPNVLQLLEENTETALGALSPKNQREYYSTFNMWKQFAIGHNISYLNFDLMLVQKFLKNSNWGSNTRYTRFAHIKKFAHILSLSDSNNLYNWGLNYGRLGLIVRKSLGGKKSIVSTKSLTRNQVYKIFDAWNDEDNQNLRNSCLLGLMLLSGLRSMEVINLVWQDVDYEENTIFVRNGKGEKSAHIPMLGDIRHILLSWQAKQAESGDYDFVACTISRGDTCGKNKKVSKRVIQSLIKKTCDMTGIDFNPHDTRRTAITELIRNGASVPDTRDFARHSQGSTTLEYSKKNTAKNLASRLDDKLSYGDVLGAKNHSENGREYECSNAHKFTALNPLKCPFCDDTDLSRQTSMFDD